MAEAGDPCNQTIGWGVNPLFSIALVSGPSISAIKGVVVMHRMMNSVIFSAFLAGAAWVGPSPAAFAAVRDGNWSVLIITEKGECDRGYRYEVTVANGRVSYRGDSGIDLAGSVAPDGSTKVSIKVGDKGASGTGHLSGRTGAGVWRGVGANGSCAGRWEAELE
jgi:hypothetical protein